MYDTKKFTRIETPVDKKISAVQKTVKKTVTNMEAKGNVTSQQKTLITGITENGGMKHSPVFKPVVPYPYPLFKIHKCSEEQIATKAIPPIRLVHSTKQGPLYRLEKWCSPYLTDISREYCKAEFILDTPHSLKDIEDLNKTWPKNDKSLLFTLDVVALYPSISVDMALKAMADAFSNDTQHNTSTKEAVSTFSEVILKNSFIVFDEAEYVGKEGIPTGNCISRQVADMSMNWLLFKQLKIRDWNTWNLIRLWKRYIDDILGRWRGTERQFHMFVSELNRLAAPFGIQFSDVQIGTRVNYLDVQLYLDEEGQIQYCLHRKKTDARQYLNTSSFHPPEIFNSVAFSQMLRIINRNSTDETCVTDLEELKTDLAKCGHIPERLDEMEPKVVQRTIANKMGLSTVQSKRKSENTLVFTTNFFQEVKSLKSLVHNLKDDIKLLIGDVRIIFALKKHPAIESYVVKNRGLSHGFACNGSHGQKLSQSCGGKGCETCPLLFGLSEKVVVNGQEVILDPALNCKSKMSSTLRSVQFVLPIKIKRKTHTLVKQQLQSVYALMGTAANSKWTINYLIQSQLCPSIASMSTLIKCVLSYSNLGL